MIITARVHNHSVILPAEIKISEGTEVQVTLPEMVASSSPNEIVEQEEARRSELLALVCSLTGSISLPPGKSDEELITEARLEKYGVA